MTKVIIVEDEALVALDLADDLTAEGFQVIGFACSAGQAFEIANARRPDIAIIDVILEGECDGVCVAEVLRRKGVEVIFHSVWANKEEIVSRAMTVGPVAFLGKPCRSSALLAAVQKAAEIQARARTKKVSALRRCCRVTNGS